MTSTADASLPPTFHDSLLGQRRRRRGERGSVAPQPPPPRPTADREISILQLGDYRSKKSPRKCPLRVVHRHWLLIWRACSLWTLCIFVSPWEWRASSSRGKINLPRGHSTSNTTPPSTWDVSPWQKPYRQHRSDLAIRILSPLAATRWETESRHAAAPIRGLERSLFIGPRKPRCVTMWVEHLDPTGPEKSSSYRIGADIIQRGCQ